MHTLTDCEQAVKNVLQDSAYQESYKWDNTDTEQTSLNRTNGTAMAVFIAEIIQDNNAPCVEEVIGLLEEFIQECTATEKTTLLEELRVALNNAG
ncbi:hypothetical protein [Halodesulfovibrio spirochaetisodalis]|uniref:Uncharacterized protein n=1 Tax=Halodesulfovibrio spirochaetisodalis TaxID=1560234 RepID=A0A1B7XDS1_9BACT|nr:hypothetical protein [Halodesulfovibrio spirochaetisodalis]OBQ52144.1 hypothetical protein SP90_08190 [Halodesulfovibrio spirochaetisodalis]